MPMGTIYYTQGIRARRVSPTGTVVDTTPLLLSTSMTTAYQTCSVKVPTRFASVASDGMNWLVTYISQNCAGVGMAQYVLLDHTAAAKATGTLVSSGVHEIAATFGGAGNGYGVVYWSDKIYATGINVSGVASGGATTVASPGTVNQPALVLASNASGYLAAWGDAQQDVSAMRLSPTFAPVDAAPFPVSLAANQETNVAVAFNGRRHLAVWEDQRRAAGASATTSDVRGARIGTDGTVADPNGLQIGGTAAAETAPAVASNGTDFLVTWQDARSGVAQIYGARVTDTGALPDTLGFAVSSGLADQTTPAVASDGASYFVVWTVGGAVNGARVNAAGQVQDATPVIVTATGAHPAVAFNGAQYLVVWDRSGDIFGARVGTDGKVVGSELTVSAVADYQLSPVVASNGQDWMVSWADTAVTVARVSGAGGLMDTFGVPVSTKVVTSIAMAWDGSAYWLAWDTNSDIFGRRVSPAGTLVDAADFTVAAQPQPENVPSVAAQAPGQALIAYHRFDPSPPFGAVRARARLATDTSAGGTGGGGAGGADGGAADGGGGADGGAAGAGGADAGGTGGTGGSVVADGGGVGGQAGADASTSSPDAGPTDAGGGSDTPVADASADGAGGAAGGHAGSGGAGGNGTDGGGGSRPSVDVRANSGCSCALDGGPSSGASLAGLLAIAFAVTRRRRSNYSTRGCRR
jgi:MYXO-CTERM domain-containing protein